MALKTESKPVHEEGGLRGLSAEEFHDLYGTDRFTATVLSSRFQYVIKHVCSNLLTSAFSPVLRDYYDFSAALSAPAELGYAVPAVAREGVASFFGSIRDAVADAVLEFGAGELSPGDVLMTNDPYRCGTHVNDMCFIRPVFSGRGEIVAFLTIRAHMVDLGAVVPGGFSGKERTTYESGLIVPPTLLRRKGKLVRSAISGLLDNIRLGHLIVADIATICAALDLGESLLLESLAKYGYSAFRGVMAYRLDAAAETMRDAIRGIPDGTYVGEELIDSDGVSSEVAYRVRVSIKKAGGRLEVDFSGSSRQARTAINAAWPDSKGAVAIALKFLLDPGTAFASSSLRHVDIVLPLGTTISARPPAGPVFAYWEPIGAAISAMMKALSAPLGERAVAGDSRPTLLHSAHGVNRDGTPWVSVALAGGKQGGWGATMDGDADSGQAGITSNVLDAATEVIEADTPAVIVRKEYLTDSAGPGLHRGGAGMVKDSYWLADSSAQCLAVHVRRPCGFGVAGGGDGTLGGAWLWEPEEGSASQESLFRSFSADELLKATPVAGMFDPRTNMLSADGDYRYWAARPFWETPSGSTWRYVTCGGGGWGNPLERLPGRVLADVRDEYVSIEGAARDYGVVVRGDPAYDPEGLTVDEVATTELRQKMAASAGDAAPPRPEEVSCAEAVTSDRSPVLSSCPACDSPVIARYTVLRDLGWYDVVKCQSCLHTLEASPSTVGQEVALSASVLNTGTWL